MLRSRTLLAPLHAQRPGTSTLTTIRGKLTAAAGKPISIRTVPPAKDLDVSVLSYLVRTDSPYISNRFPVGRMPQLSRQGTIIDMGEEARNNRKFGDFGNGRVLFLNIPRSIEPVSTGLLSNTPNAPDHPTLSPLCAQTQQIGGTVVWCHNGSGVEVPVAAVLGLVDAYNLVDGLAADYERYYKFLNCGLRIAASNEWRWPRDGNRNQLRHRRRPNLPQLHNSNQRRYRASRGRQTRLR